MARSRKNPIGMSAPNDAVVVRVGKGEHTHFFDGKAHLCRSGKNVGGPGMPQIFASKAKYVTCYRCAKLGQMNVDAGRKPWQKRGR